LREERADFHMDYRMKCDVDTKAALDRATKAEAALAERDKDAERYRRLRDEKGSRVRICTFEHGPAIVITGDEADAAIDAALAAQAKP
jgi:hypothetical protein